MIQSKPKGLTLPEKLHKCAMDLKARNQIPDESLVESIADSKWFQDYLKVCLNHPISNAMLGCIIFGWQLCEEVKKLEDGIGVIYRA